MVSLFRAPAKAKTRKQSSNSGAHATRMSPRSKRSRRRNSNSRKPEREAATVSEPGCDPHCTIFNRSQNPNFNESTLNSVNGNSTTVTYQYNYYISGNLHLSQDGSHSSGVAPTPEENGKKYKQSRHKKHSTH
ncbi:hypothetical protein VKT23_016024 [Stygiomarasmius scandens]|uniref:Uncharacterized protein n=1 Tax=Marasmiellus scandens TaxID=2682957 RepID=A0ABR1IZJ8_9AGAR